MSRATFERLLATDAPRPVVLIRALVGWVFVSEGIQKLLFPDELGAGRFTKIGIPAAEIMGPFVGILEIVCGALVLVGLLTRLAALSLMLNMAVAITSTKIPILLGRGFWGFAAPKAKPGLWSMAHESRTDFSMLLGAAFLLVVGAGGLSVDAWLTRRARQGEAEGSAEGS